MNIYETDDEKVEAIKRWWKENGLSVVGGVGIGLAAVFGWRGWIAYQDGVSQQASAAFEQLLSSADSGSTDSALKQSELLTAEYGSTVYGTFSALVKAKVELEKSNSAGARAALEQVMASAPDPGLATIAALRLARLLIDEGDLPAAAAVLGKQGATSRFAAEIAALRGDIAAAEGRVLEAREAYEQALAAGATPADLLQLKLDNLPPAG